MSGEAAGLRESPRVAAVLRALHPGTAPWAVVPGLRAMVAVGAIAVVGALTGHLLQVGLAYFGASCAAVFATAGVYRTRLLTALGQGVGACVGIALASLAPDTPIAEVCVAVLLGLVVGAIGTVGPVLTAWAVMAVIGLGYGQFAGIDLPWWQQAAWILVGAGVVAGVAIAPWVFRRDYYQRSDLADVLDAAADLFGSVGTPDSGAARDRLAAAVARARGDIRDRRLRSGLSTSDGARRREQLLAAAHDLAVAAASAHADGSPIPGETVAVVRSAAQAVRRGDEVADPGELSGPPDIVAALRHLASPDDIQPDWPTWSVRLRSGWRTISGRPARIAGLRLALCLGIATAVTAAWHDETHSYWITLTVAVIVRPEYASVFVRSVNRIAGTLVGALFATVVLFAVPSGLPTALLAAVSIGLAVFAAPRSYAMCVIGVTCSALLSASIGSADPVFPVVRLADTLVGTVIALVFGYLLWPGHRGLPETVRFDLAFRATECYLDQALLPPDRRTDWSATLEEAYRLAHGNRAAVYGALADPPATSQRAAAALPAAIGLESVVDEVSRLAAVTDRGESPSDAEVAGLHRRLDRIRSSLDAADTAN